MPRFRMHPVGPTNWNTALNHAHADSGAKRDHECTMKPRRRAYAVFREGRGNSVVFHHAMNPILVRNGLCNIHRSKGWKRVRVADYTLCIYGAARTYPNGTGFAPLQHLVNAPEQKSFCFSLNQM